MLTCETVSTLSGAYALDLLPPAEAAALAVHVAACVACGERARARQQTGEWLAHLVTPAPLPAGLRQRLQLRLQDQGRPRPQATTPLPPPPAPSPARPRSVWPWVLAGVVCLSLIGNLDLLQERQTLQAAQARADAEHRQLLQQLRRQVQARAAAVSATPVRISHLQGSRRHPMATGSLTFQSDSRRWSLSLQGLPVLPAGQVYQLWAGAGERPSPVLAFRLGTATTSVPVPPHAALRPGTALLVTVEAGAGHDRPTGDLVLLGMVADP
jgi:hypothetical protein